MQMADDPAASFVPAESLGYPSWLYDSPGPRRVAIAWLALACTQFPTPTPAIAGMAYQLWQKNLQQAAIEFVVQALRERRAVPTGLHRFDPGPGFSRPADRLVHFPRMPCCVTSDGRLFVPAAQVLAEDWYMSGMEFQRIHPAGGPARVLRHPIRDNDDDEIFSIALAHLAPQVDVSVFGAADALREPLQAARKRFLGEHGFPPNLAAIWRAIECMSEESRVLREAIEKAANMSSAGNLRIEASDESRRG